MAGAEPAKFAWKEHTSDLVRVGTSSNFKFKCVHCGTAISGSKTRLMNHILGTGTMACRAAPDGVVQACREERASKKIEQEQDSIVVDVGKVETKSVEFIVEARQDLACIAS